jgi:Major Facilitator Superfamily
VARSSAIGSSFNPIAAPGDEKRTLSLDFARSGVGGFIDACERTFFLLVAIKVLDGNLISKSIIAGATGFGFLFSPLVVQWVRRSERVVTEPASYLLMASALASAFAAVFRIEALFVFGAALGLALQGCVIPFITAIYNRNYPVTDRGKYVSASIWVRVLCSTLLAIFVARELEQKLPTNANIWRIVPIGAAISYGIQAILIRRIPASSLRLRADEPQNEKEAWKFRIHLIKTDRLLRNVLAAWMFMGFANLMMLPLRVEYITNKRYGIAFGPERITLITLVIPALVRLVMTVPFGWAFDRLSFFAMRIVVNVVFALSIVSFFLGKTMTGFVVGSALFGLAIAGGDVLWNLWTIKFAPPGRVSDYMALHTFTTGIRGVVAPFFGFYLITRVSISMMGFVCAGLIGVSSMILIPQFMIERKARAGRAVTAA